MATKQQVLEEAAKNRGCLGMAYADEPVFVLRARDSLAPETVERWARELAQLKGADTSKVRTARAIAHEMRAWQELNSRKVPD